MPNKYRVVFLFEGNQDGWSETHIFDSAVSAPGGMAGPMKAIMAKRALMLGNQYKGVGIRIRKVYDTLGNKVKRSQFPVVQDFPASGAADNQGDPDFVAALGIGTDAGGDNQTRVFLGGIPDAVTVLGGSMDFNQPLSNPFGSRFSQWAAALNGQVGPQGEPITVGYFKFPPIATGLVISSYAQSAGDIITYTITEDIPPELLGVVVRARVSRLNGSRSILNREQLVYASGARTLTTIKPHAAFPFQGQGQMILYSLNPTFVGIAGWQLEQFAARHKRGRPFKRSRGRAPALPLG